MLLKTKLYLLFLFTLIFSFYFSQAQPNEKIYLTKIIFHSSQCFGTCPSIDLEIDSSKRLFVNREYYKDRGKIDKRFTGQFLGFLDQTKYNKLIELLQDCQLDTLKFPDVTCCDRPVITIIVYYNGGRKYLKSMTPPEKAKELISFLKEVGNDKSLIKTNEKRTIEE